MCANFILSVIDVPLSTFCNGASIHLKLWARKLDPQWLWRTLPHQMNLFTRKHVLHYNKSKLTTVGMEMSSITCIGFLLELVWQCVVLYPACMGFNREVFLYPPLYCLGYMLAMVGTRTLIIYCFHGELNNIGFSRSFFTLNWLRTDTTISDK